MLTNYQENDSTQYFAKLLAGDLNKALERWEILAYEHPDSESRRNLRLDPG